MQQMPEKRSIYFTYKHVDKPWGGANNFIRALNSEIRKRGEMEILQSPSKDCDFLFMIELGSGRGNPENTFRYYTFDEVKEMMGPETKLIVRAVNLRYTTSGYKYRNVKETIKYFKEDRNRIKLLNMADHVIFLSDWQRSIFTKYGYKGPAYSVIHNGAADVFTTSETVLPLSGKLQILTACIQTRGMKLHHLIKELAGCDDVDMHYAGKWPDDIDPGKVKFHGVLTHDELAQLWKKMHYCFHPAAKDPCPNAVCEALACGVPVIYNPKPGGTVELASPTGVALQEDNLPATVREAREKYAGLAAKTRERSSYYSITRAYDEYMKVFNEFVD